MLSRSTCAHRRDRGRDLASRQAQREAVVEYTIVPVVLRAAISRKELFAAACTAVAFALAVPSAQAQSRAYLFKPAPTDCVVNCVGTLSTIAVDVPAIVRSVAVGPGRLMATPYATSDGRFVAWSEGDQLVLHDVSTGGTTAIDAPGAFVGNPAQPELYVGGSVPMALSMAGARPLSSLPGCPSVAPAAVSGDGSKVLFRCGFTGTFVVDTLTGALLATLPGALAASLNTSGEIAYLFVNGPPASGSALRRYAVATATQTHEVLVPSTVGNAFEANISSMMFDRRTDQVVLLGRAALAFDAATLQTLSIKAFAFCPPYGGGTISLDVDRPRSYVSLACASEPSFERYYSYFVGNPDTGTNLLRVDTGRESLGTLIAAPVPPEPTTLTSQVAGAAVTLSWTPGTAFAQPTRYVVEAGTGPGLANLATFDVGLQTQLVVQGVPAGSYYVRVRAVNYTGPSGPSNEVVVVVP